MAVPVDPTLYRSPNRLLAVERGGARHRVSPRPVPVGLPTGWSGSPLATVLRDITTLDPGRGLA